MAEEPDTTVTSVSEVYSPKTTEGEFSEAPTDSEIADVEHSDEEEEEEENVTELLVNPSKNIKEDLKRILTQDGSKYTGSFSSSKSYANAPNPGLNIEGVGVIGLPLSEPAAKRLISGCIQAPFGKGERTIVDKSVRDTWEMDASKVNFENPAWTEWIESQVVLDVCEVLGVGLASANPKVELYKLLVYETGSHFLPHQDTEKTPGMFATIVIILPSKFTGGSLQLSHAGESKEVDISAQSGFATHVAAWYTDVFHSVNPIHSGYRLALSYNLIHTNAPSLKPVLDGMNAEAQELSHVLLSWNQSKYPKRLLYLLDHMYSESNLHLSLLKGKDQQLVARIRGIAERLRIRICLVSLELHQVGQADDWGDRAYDTVKMVEVDESDFSITCAYDLNGKKVELHEDLDLDEADCIPYELSKMEPDDQDYEGYQGNHGGNIDLWYRRTALLIWPRKFDATIAQRNYVLEAREALQAVKSRKPTKLERLLVDELIDWMKSEEDVEDVDNVVEVVTRAALHWKDVDMWIDTCKAVRIDQRMGGITAAEIVDGVEALGFGGLKDFLADVMKNNTSDGNRLHILCYLRDMATKTENGETERWVDEWEFQVLRSLRSLEVEAVTNLVNAIQRPPDSVILLQEVIMPQITAVKPSKDFLVAFNTTLRSYDLASPDITRSLLSLAILQAEVFPKQEGTEIMDEGRADIASWIQTLELAMNTDTPLIKVFCERMANSWKGQLIKSQDWLAKEFFPLAIIRLQSWCESQKPPIPQGNDLLVPFWKTTVNCYLPRMDRYYNQLVFALRWCGGVDLMKDELIALFKQFFTKDQSNGGRCVLQVHAAIKSASETEVSLHTELLGIATEVLAKHSPITPMAKGPPNIDTMKSILVTLRTCGIDISTKLYLERLSKLTPRNMPSRVYIHDYLLPFMIEVIPGYRLQPPIGPLPEFVLSALNRAVTTLGPMPSSNISLFDLRSLGCGCQDCQDLSRFAQSEHPSIAIPGKQRIQSHIEKQLKGKAKTMGFTWETQTGPPYSLVITKPPKLIKQTQWPIDKDKVIKAMDAIGPLAVQKRVLQAKWPEFCEKLMLDPSIADKNPNGFHDPTKRKVLVAPQPSGNAGATATSTADTVPRASSPVAKQLPSSGTKVNIAEPSTSTAVRTTLPKGQGSKRPFEQAMGGQASSSSAPIPKRSKPSKAPLEIIELSD